MSIDFAKALASTLALTLCACGATPPKADSANDELHVHWDGQKPAAEPSGTTREVSARELSVVQELVRAAERVRGLRFRQKVPVLVQDAEAIMAYVREPGRRVIAVSKGQPLAASKTWARAADKLLQEIEALCAD